MPSINERLNSALADLTGLNEEITQLEARLAILNAAKDALERGTLIEVFNEADIREVVYNPTGRKAKRELVMTGGLNKNPDERPLAIQWICDAGYEDTIENKVVGSWTRGDRQKALTEYNRLRSVDNAAKVSFEEGIHPSTLKKIIRERLVGGVEVPMTLLGVDVTSRVRFVKR